MGKGKVPSTVTSAWVLRRAPGRGDGQGGKETRYLGPLEARGKRSVRFQKALTVHSLGKLFFPSHEQGSSLGRLKRGRGVRGGESKSFVGALCERGRRKWGSDRKECEAV